MVGYWQRAAEEQECARLGHPVGSERCWTGSNGDISVGEVGTVKGLAATEKGKIVVEFGKGAWMFSSDQLISVEEHGRQAKAAAEEAARQRQVQAAADAERRRADEARAAQAVAAEAEKREREAAAWRALEAEAEHWRARAAADAKAAADAQVPFVLRSGLFASALLSKLCGN